MPSALIYGHSQSGGMGLDLEKALRKRGWKVSRTTRVGWNDGKLLVNVDDVQVQADAADRVYLYGGGNSDKPSVKPLRELVQALGAAKTVLILPPVNTDRDADDVAAQRLKNKGNADGLADLVPVVQVEASGDNFWGDKIHMRPGSPQSLAVADQLVQPLAAGGGVPVALVAGLVGLAALMLLRRVRG